VKSILINLSNGMGIAIQEDYPWKDNLASQLGDVNLVGKTKTAEVESISPSLLVKPSSVISTEDMYYSNEGVYIDNNALFDVNLKTLIRINPDKKIILESDAPCHEWFSWGIQLALLHNNVTFVHGVAFEKENMAVLIAAKGGVGKTAIAEYFVRELGWELLGDDLVIVDRAGSCYSFPKPFVLYPYHKTIFPEIFSDKKKILTPSWLSPWVSKLVPKVKPILQKGPNLPLEFIRKHNPQFIKANPSEIFGASSVAKEAKLKKVIWLEKDRKVGEPVYKASDEGLSSRMLASTMLEFNPRCVRLSLMAIRHAVLDGKIIFHGWLNILDEVVKVTPEKARLSLPANLPIEETGPVVARHILEKGSW